MMKGCMYSAQGDLVCNKSTGGPAAAAKPWIERFEEAEQERMHEAYYEEPEQERMHEGYYEEPEERMHEGYYEDAPLPETEQFYNGFAPSFANMGNAVSNMGQGVANTVSNYRQNAMNMFGGNRGPAARR